MAFGATRCKTCVAHAADRRLMATFTEENYLKAIYKLAERSGKPDVSTTALAEALQTRAASVSEMLRRLAEKGTIQYEKYRGARLTSDGRAVAVLTIRRHRLWEVFLVEKLGFSWDEVHEVAEEMEHLTSSLLLERLDAFLGHPDVDPHGDPIPSADGQFRPVATPLLPLAEVPPGAAAWCVMSLLDTSARFLQHLDRLGLRPGTALSVIERFEYDGTLRVQIANGPMLTVSRDTALKVLVQ
jgi:DtxR family transcriptional regulator, Mn-dependent transcriptional regulator